MSGRGPGLDPALALLGAAVDGAERLARTHPEIERALARLVSFIRRRVTGEYDIDEFGLDREFTEGVLHPLVKVLYDKWFHVSVVGAERIPSDGPALLVANHSGTIALDGVILSYAVHRNTAERRILRLLAADLVFGLPVVGDLARRSGSALASADDAARLLGDGELVGVFPEGFKGVGKGWSQRYRLQRFGRGGFVSTAIRAGVPIIPVSIVGAEEAYPMIADISPLARTFGLPYFPVTPTFPLLGLLGLVPLPSRWVIEIGEPIDTAHLGADAAEDPMEVFELTDVVREKIQSRLYALLRERRRTFF
ncbi:lysophospholipid acyltransferase family protein [Cumulibacter manganitolerans]|uniref:lysophospholipid acyltransferase family protein n=1 Tax=Cumulibacter manganitolerans TaxID=1884992 RepID=UPI001294B325|nr:lysophospholipid acyltransferase family protein [Cumulibacter manganitolerans]